MIVLKPVRIDLARPARAVVHCMQTDNTQRVDVSLFVNNRPYDVTADVASGETVTMAVAYILPNGFGDEYTETALGETAVEQDSTIAHLYHVMIDGACTDVDGFVQIIVRFTTDGGQILNSFPLTLDVIKSQPDDVDPGGNTPALSRYLRVDLLPAATEDDTGTVVWDAINKLLKYVPGSGGGGTADVTAAAVKSAIEAMDATQKAALKTALGYLTQHQSLTGYVTDAALADYVLKSNFIPPQLGCGYATCSSLDEVTAKVITLENFILRIGGMVAVRFTYPVAANTTMNINSTAAVPIYWRGAAITSNVIGMGETGLFVFDGNYFHLIAVDRSPSGSTPTWQDILPPGGIPATDLAASAKPLIVTIASDGQGGYTTDASETDILAAVSAGRVVLAQTPYGRMYYGNDDDGASFYGLAGPSNARSIPRFNIDGTTVTYSTFVVPSSGSGGGAEVFDVTITTSPQSSSKTAAEIYAATQAGKIIRAKIDGNDAVILALAFQNEAVFYSIETDSGRVLSAVTVGVSNGNTTVSVDSWPIGNANEPDKITLTGATPAITVVVDNTIYTGGTLTSLDVGTWTNDRHFRLIFTSGSTATQLNWGNNHAPVWPSNFDGTPAANTRYEIDVEGGYAVVGAWEVS